MEGAETSAAPTPPPPDAKLRRPDTTAIDFIGGIIASLRCSAVHCWGEGGRAARSSWRGDGVGYRRMGAHFRFDRPPSGAIFLGQRGQKLQYPAKAKTVRAITDAA